MRDIPEPAAADQFQRSSGSPAASRGSEERLISAVGVSKSYGRMRALDEVDFDLRPGEIHALLGANGAGKSTLIKIFAGVTARDAGELSVLGTTLGKHFSRATVAQTGLAFVHQDLGLCEHLSVSENIAISIGYQRRGRLISFAQTEQRVAQILASLSIDIDPRAMVGELRQDEKVMVAVARAFSTNARAVVLDEVSSSLPAPDVAALARVLKASRDQGVGYVYVTHRVDELFGMADRITVLRDGKRVRTSTIADTTREQIVDWIVGPTPESARTAEESRSASMNEKVLTVDALLSDRVGPVSFEARRGEIIGFCGLLGCGARELAGILGGAIAPRSGSATLAGQRLPLGSASALRRQRCTYVPGDRKIEGGVVEMTVRENLLLSRAGAKADAGFFRWPRAERTESRALADQYDIRPREAVDWTFGTLSGGNQQKVVVSRALRDPPRLVVTDDLTAGVDVGARAQIHDLLRSAAASGAVVILASTDYDEVATLADRAFVLVNGQVHRVLTGRELTADNLALASYAQEPESLSPGQGT